MFLKTCSIIITKIIAFPVVNLFAYSFAHILLIYIGIYHFHIMLYLVFFVLGIIFDISLLNEIGPHLITFVLLILLLSQIKKFYTLLSSNKILLIIILILSLTLISEMLISLILFNYGVNFSILLNNLLISLLISYPTFYLFSKIDMLD